MEKISTPSFIAFFGNRFNVNPVSFLPLFLFPFSLWKCWNNFPCFDSNFKIWYLKIVRPFFNLTEWISVQLVFYQREENHENGRSEEFIFEVFVCAFIVYLPDSNPLRKPVWMRQKQWKWSGKKPKGNEYPVLWFSTRGHNDMMMLLEPSFNTKGAQSNHIHNTRTNLAFLPIGVVLLLSFLWSQIVFTIIHRMKSMTLEEQRSSQCWTIWLWSFLACVAVYNTIYVIVHLCMTESVSLKMIQWIFYRVTTVYW